jgi:septum formation protein
LLVLASASPARRRLLEQAGLPHRVRVSGIDEEAETEADPLRLVERLAAAKASAVAAALASEEAWPLWGVLGCDSLLVVQGEVWGKPRDAAEAVARWRRMAGGWGELHTGHCLLSGPAAGSAPGPQQAVVTTRVLFAPLTTREIEAYVATGEPLACAGGFALEGRGGLVVERLDGCWSNVIGLSLPLLRRWLASALVSRPGDLRAKSLELLQD